MTTERKKEVGIVVLVALHAILFFLLYALLLREGGSGPFLVPVVFVIGISWVALVSTAFGFVGSRTGASTALVVIPSLVALAMGGFSVEALIGSFILAVFLAIGWRDIRTEIKDRVKIRVRSVFWRGTQAIIIGFAIMLIALSLPTVKQFVASGIFFPPQTVSFLLKPMTPVIAGFLPGYQYGATVNQIIDTQLQQQQLPVELNDAERQATIDQLSVQFGLPVQGEDTLESIISRVVNGYIHSLASKDGAILVLILISSAFFTVRAILPILRWIALALIAILVYTSRRIELIYVIKSQVDAEHFKL